MQLECYESFLAIACWIEGDVSMNNGQEMRRNSTVYSERVTQQARTINSKGHEGI